MAYLHPPITPEGEDNKSLIIFAGAGASRGVSAEKYPMAIDFRERLPEEITGTPLYRQLIDYLKLDYREGVDIEHVLWEIGRLIEAIDKWTDGASFGAQLLKTNQISVIVPANIPAQQTHEQLLRLKEVALRLQGEINKQVYKYYSQHPSESELGRSWLPLLHLIGSKKFFRVDIVTTNYDLVIENAIEAMDEYPIDLGYINGVSPRIDLERWREGSSARLGMLTKLHGSVDWKLGDGGTESAPIIRRGHPEFDGDHDKRLIVYPGFKGHPVREPFVAFHDYFERRLKNASHMLFIGFAFRDEHINELISSALSPVAAVGVVDPVGKLPRLNFLQGATHLQQGFGVDKKATILESGGVKPFSLKDIDDWLEG